jgi:hypothetical protein
MTISLRPGFLKHTFLLHTVNHTAAFGNPMGLLRMIEKPGTEPLANILGYSKSEKRPATMVG